MNRNIKVFITASLLIHLVGGVTLYMYYFAPSPPQLVNGEKEDGSQTKIISPGPDIKSHGKSPKKQDRAENTGKKVTRQAKNKGTPIKTPLSQKSKVVSKDLPNKSKADPLFKKATGSSNKGMEMSRDSAIKKRDAQKSSGKEVPFSTGEADLANKAGKKAENQDGVSGRSQAEQLKEESAQVKKASSKNTASPTEKTSLAIEKGEQQEDTVKNPLETAPSNEKAPLKVSENKISSEAIPLSNQKEKSSVGSEIEGETVSPSIPENSKSSLKFRNFLNLKQKWGNPKLEYPLEAREKKLQGTVAIVYFVSPEGLVDKIQLKKSSGHPLLDNFVLRTVARYEFLPQQEGWVQHTVDFVLEGEEEQILKLRDRDK